MNLKQYEMIKKDKTLLTIESTEIQNRITHANKFLIQLENAITILKNTNIDLKEVISYFKKNGVKMNEKTALDMIQCRTFLLTSSESLRNRALLLVEELSIAKKKEEDNLKLFNQFEELYNKHNDDSKNRLENIKIKKKV